MRLQPIGNLANVSGATTTDAPRQEEVEVLGGRRLADVGAANFLGEVSQPGVVKSEVENNGLLQGRQTEPIRSHGEWDVREAPARKARIVALVIARLSVQLDRGCTTHEEPRRRSREVYDVGRRVLGDRGNQLGSRAAVADDADALVRQRDVVPPASRVEALAWPVSTASTLSAPLKSARPLSEGGASSG